MYILINVALHQFSIRPIELPEKGLYKSHSTLSIHFKEQYITRIVYRVFYLDYPRVKRNYGQQKVEKSIFPRDLWKS